MPRAFVYGAQMIHPESVGVAWPARVHDHAVRFVASGVPLLEPAFAALEPAPGEIAHGVIVDFEVETWAELVRHERSYEVVEVEAELLEPGDVEVLACERVACVAFRICAPLARERRPSARYARKLAAGARAHGLPAEVVARYERAVAEGSRVTLALAWLYPVASRIGLVPTTVLVLSLVLVSLIGLIFAVCG